jgi:hypothetical protein
MGEYASYNGESVKIGTCEDMYYLRYADRAKVQHERGNVDTHNAKTVQALRFRFPWPDEDHLEPGDHGFHGNGYARAVAIPGFDPSPETRAQVEHHSVQFTAQGYVTSLPCPESGQVVPGVTIHRNGFAGSVLLRAQKYVPGVGLVPILACGGCGAMWREEDRSEIERIAVAFRSEGDRLERMGAHNGTGAADRAWWDKVASRVLDGIGL